MTMTTAPLTHMPADVAAMLGVEVSTLANWRALGKGPQWIKFSGRVRYLDEDIEDFVEQARREARAAMRRAG